MFTVHLLWSDHMQGNILCKLLFCTLPIQDFGFTLHGYSIQYVFSLLLTY